MEDKAVGVDQCVHPDTDKSLDEAAKVRYLSPGDFELLRGEAGTLRMTLKDERSILRIKTRRCFPFTYPAKFISVRDGGDEELGIIRDLAELSKEHRRWIEDDLDMRYYTPQITAIRQIRYRFGGVEWYLETDRGSKRAITRGVHDTMTEVQPGRYIVTDVDGNRYELLVDQLDEASREKVEQLI